MKTVYLIRHGEVEYERNNKGEPLVYGPDIPLSELGRKQLKKLSERLKKEDIEAIYISPYKRTVESAKVFRAQFNRKPTVIKVTEFRDSDNFKYTSKRLTIAKIADVINNNKDKYFKQVPNRIIGAVKKLLKNTPFKCFVIMSHGDALSSLIYFFDNKKLPPDYRTVSQHFYIKKGEAVEYELDKNLKNAKRIKIISLLDVQKSIEHWRK